MLNLKIYDKLKKFKIKSNIIFTKSFNSFTSSVIASILTRSNDKKASSPGIVV